MTQSGMPDFTKTAISKTSCASAHAGSGSFVLSRRETETAAKRRRKMAGIVEPYFRSDPSQAEPSPIDKPASRIHTPVKHVLVDCSPHADPKELREVILAEVRNRRELGDAKVPADVGVDVFQHPPQASRAQPPVIRLQHWPDCAVTR